MMNSTAPHVIVDSNLSHAWVRAYKLLLAQQDKELSPLLVSLTGFDGGDPVEEAGVRGALDDCLEANGMQTINTVANTIFPQSLWKRANGDRQRLFAEYMENLPDYVAMMPSKNRRGLYFSRLIAFGTDPKTGEKIPHMFLDHLPDDGNQLEYLIQKCKRGVRRSMFQASVFDPMRDHVASAQLGFPCLQHVSFVPDFVEGTLALNAFYATQQLFEKAYGNYLGLCRLGAFMAHEIRLRFSQMNCFVGIGKMEKKPCRDATLENLQGVLAGSGVSAEGQVAT